MIYVMKNEKGEYLNEDSHGNPFWDYRKGIFDADESAFELYTAIFGIKGKIVPFEEKADKDD